jgi:membrane protein YdbS with pleckstrin-like domain
MSITTLAPEATRLDNNNLLYQCFNRTYLSITSAARVSLVLVATFSLLHFFAPANSYAGNVLANVMTQPIAVIVFILVVTVLSCLYYYKLAGTYALLHAHDNLSFSKGNLIQTTIRLSKSNINHITLERSLIERWLGLATLKLFSPGSHKPTIILASLHLDAAEELQQFIQQK